MGVLYAKDGKIFCNEYMELYIPMLYFNSGIAVNKGASVETFGMLYTRAFPKDIKEDPPIKLFNLPVVTNFMVYESKNETIHVNGKSIDVMTLKYLKDSYIVHQTVTKGREVANTFLDSMLSGKIPNTLNYLKIIDIWWKNLEISGISYKVPSKIYEMIIANIYRNPNNMKERYGQYFSKHSNATGYDYKTENVRSVVKDLSTFSGMVFEDIGMMISNGISNSLENFEEPVSPLEKIIHY